MGKTTKIDWCDSTWNPVTGCLKGCEYCYARRIAERFGSHMQPLFRVYPILHEPVHCSDTYAYMREAGISKGNIQPYPFDFHPTFHRYKLDEPARWTNPRNIFVVSMGDLFGDWVPDEWIREVFEACVDAPQHRYLFLTKNPHRYMLYENEHPLMTPDRENFWYGTTITGDADYGRIYPLLEWKRYNGANVFVSLEPLHFAIWNNGRERIAMADWVIIGAETGNRKNLIKPRKEWIDEIVYSCVKRKTPIFMKESLRDLMGDDFRQEFPWT